MPPPRLTDQDLAKAGLKGSQLARIVGRDKVDISKMKGSPEKSWSITPSNEMFVLLILWPHAPEELKERLLRGELWAAPEEEDLS